MEEYTDKKVQDSKTQAMIQKLKTVAHAELEGSRSGIVIIRLKDGREYTKRVDITTGNPAKPLSLGQMSDKYRSCAESIIDKERIEKSIDKILSF